MSRNHRLAVALKTLVELLRRHPELRLAELHPGGGMYDTLAVWRASDVRVFCQFNLLGSSLALNPLPTGRPPRSGSEAYHGEIWKYSETSQPDALVPLLQERLGLPARPVGPARPATVAHSVGRHVKLTQ